MSSRFHVDANLISTPFSTAANTIGARNEERRQERIYGGAPRPQQDGYAKMTANAARYTERMNLEVQSRASFGTKDSKSQTYFSGKTYSLPPIREQEFLEVHEFGSIDQHFGGLGLKSHMVEWFVENSGRIDDYNFRASAYNKKIANKGIGGLFKKKADPAKLLPMLQGADLDVMFNRKLVEARVAARVDFVDGNYVMQHPSSESGNPQAELHAWATAYWQGVPERPWQDTMLQVPTVPSFK